MLLVGLVILSNRSEKVCRMRYDWIPIRSIAMNSNNALSDFERCGGTIGFRFEVQTLLRCGTFCDYTWCMLIGAI